jgi:hypothetical protein
MRGAKRADARARRLRAKKRRKKNPWQRDGTGVSRFLLDGPDGTNRGGAHGCVEAIMQGSAQFSPKKFIEIVMFCHLLC